jgi:hypothetical protein
MADEQDNGADGREAGAGGNENGQQQGGELKGNTLMTKADAKDGDNGADGQEAGKDADKDKGKGKDNDKGGEADKVPDKPEGYNFKFGKDTQIDKELLSSFQKTAHELGISRDKAQKLASFYEVNAAKAVEQVAAAQQQALESAKAKWEEEIQKSPNFAQEREHIQSALRQYGDAELYALLDQTNLGAHPKMWAFVAKVGKVLAEPGFHGKNSSKEKSAAEVLYPDQGK